MSDTNSILSMTEHGAYVWPSYGIAALILIGLVVVSLRAYRRTLAALSDAEAAVGKARDEA